ncbi:MAG: AzlD domain-containing protein, partial [Lachnospiraceae bacterium]|nr:AzlD domain-containing protein [Lachnospiraceae bacterium]
MNIYIYILVMAVVTYLIRMLPLTLIRGKIKSRFIRSFLYYVPYACLMAMTFPAVFFSASSMIAAIAGVGVAIILALKGKGLMTVALAASITVFLVSL